MIGYKALVLCVFFNLARAVQFGSVPLEEVLHILVPTLNSDNPQCRNDTIFYVEELKKLRLWATEMFDASSKFPTGLLSGSTYDFGNFDECVEVSGPVTEEKIQGRYCMAKFHIAPPDFKHEEQKYARFFNGDNYFINASTWEKMIAFSNKRSRNTRNEFFFSYCIPSSCTYDDLESSLKQVTAKLNSFSDFKVTASVNPRNCQLKPELKFSGADIGFTCVVLFFILLACIATSYDWLIKLDDLKKYRLEGKKHKVLMSFSLWSNLKKLSHETENDDGLQCIHGLKVISMFLIIMGHRIMFGIGSPLMNPSFVENMYGRIEATALLNGPVIVDTFFNISGFLVCYLMLTQLEKRKRGINFLFLYLHRFIRLTPAYAMVLAFYCTLFVKMGSGPLWLERVQVEQERCVASWWANLFYLNNYINKEHICMFQSWYMTCDMHLFMISPFIIWLLRKKPFLGLVSLFVLIVASISVVFATVYLSKEDAILMLYMKFLRDPVINNTFKNIYIPTHMRASPYFVGMVTGYIKYVMKSREYKMPKYMVYMGWVMSIFIIEVTVYSAFIFYLPDKPYDPIISAIYSAMHHFTWSICISWIVIAISEGYGAWVQPVLEWKPMILLSRITYAAFLCHGAIQIYSVAILRHANYAGVFHLVFYTAGDITLAYIAGLLLSMLFESPILGLEKIILGRVNPSSDKEETCKVSKVVTPKIKIINQF
ncbi:nose resistant to fluoxetine protein 6 [Tribolium castaneum]|uniref:nose resistant to fluoxetine protein 6 n=1 Tax=Tribolium castaneum TaxID=7070 RepID=UPI0030FF0C6B